MEIKPGDKVRVSKDAPKLYANGWLHDWCNTDSIVKEVDNEDAVIAPVTRANYELAIPTQYLVKVDAEAKEAKIKLGDMVRVKGNLHEPFCLDADLHLEIPNIPPHAVSQKEWKVIKVENRRDCAEHIYTLNNGDSFIYNIPEDCIELVEPTAPKIKVGDRVRNVKSDLCGIALKIEHGIVEVGIPYDKERHYWNTDIVELFEPTEQTEAEKTNTDSLVAEIDKLIEGYRKAFADSFDWQRYEADLAKEVAVMFVRTHRNDLNKVAKMSVDIAKSVVEGLKRK